MLKIDGAEGKHLAHLVFDVFLKRNGGEFEDFGFCARSAAAKPAQGDIQPVHGSARHQADDRAFRPGSYPM